MEITILNRQRGQRVDPEALRTFLERAAETLAASRADRLAVCLVSDRSMRRYNREYRGQDRSTDVLAFPASVEGFPAADDHLGDIVVCVSRAAEQAARAGHSLHRELQILLLHGYLHLLGYDHQSDDGTMRRLERRMARRLFGSAPRVRT